MARGNAFVTPEWFWAWQRHYGTDHEPLVPVARDPRGAVVGLIPLVLEQGRGRIARFAGSGLGDYFHPVASPENETAVAAAAGALMVSGPGSPKAIVAENVYAGGAWWRELSTASGFGGDPVVDRLAPLPSLQLAGRSWDAYLASRSRNLRSQLGRKRRALERDHDVSIRWTGADDPLGRDMASLFRLHDLRWATRERGSSLTSDRARAFHMDFAAAARARGWLRLGFLEIDGEPVAGWYGWRVGYRFAYYQAGFDPAWTERSVGMLLFAESIRAAADEGAGEYDMLLGDEPFKARFADGARPVCTAVIAPRLRPSRLLAIAEARMRRTARLMPDSMRQPAQTPGAVPT